jgi:hypothetical protein
MFSGDIMVCSPVKVLLGPLFDPKMEAICSTERLFDFHLTTRSYIPEDRTLQLFIFWFVWMGGRYATRRGTSLRGGNYNLLPVNIIF